MAYIGNQVSSVPFIIDTFSGTGSATTFGQLTRSPAGVASIAVFISGVYKTPGVDYTLSGDYILFATPPASGTNNIVIHHMGNGSATSVPSDGSVTGAKLPANSIRANNIVAGQITGNLLGITSVSGNTIGINSIAGNVLGLYSVSGNNIGIGAISGNQIGIGAVSGNNIGLQSINASNSIASGTITGNLIGIQSISGNNLGINSISGNQISIKAVSGNQIGLGAISSNHFAGGGVTSDVLSSNLSISTARVAETINVVTTAVPGLSAGQSANYTIWVGNSSVYHFLANSTGNVTFNFVANDSVTTGTTGRANDLIRIGQSVSVSMLWKQGTTRYRANIHIDGVLQTAYWAGNAQPQYVLSAGSQPMSYDAYNFSIIKIGNDQYTVFASNTPFGQANGQGMSSINTGFGPIQ